MRGEEQLLSRNVEQFRGGLVFKAHRLLYHSTLGLRVIQKKEKKLDSWHSCASWSRLVPIQGYLAHKKQPPSRTLR